MIVRAYVIRQIEAQRPDIERERVNQLIDDAVRLLGNLGGYRHNTSYEDDDVVTAALVIGQDVQERRN